MRISDWSSDVCSSDLVARLFAHRRPDQRLVRVGEAGALEIGHRVRLAPHDVVEDPIAIVLERGADAENIVIAADHPDAAVRLQDALRFLEPGMGEAVRSEEHTSELQSLMSISYAV